MLSFKEIQYFTCQVVIFFCSVSVVQSKHLYYYVLLSIRPATTAQPIAGVWGREIKVTDEVKQGEI